MLGRFPPRLRSQAFTGRNDERFDAIRKTDGLSGFLSREESQHDAFGAGHAGTCLSAALGMCVARDLKKENKHVVAIAGDAAFTCGITLEALNNIACSTKKFILVLNDNEWSIAKNVGALSRYFNELITNPVYDRLHKDAQSFLSQIPGGRSFMKLVSKAKRDTKELLAPSSIFEKLGLRYLGPIDGHDIDSMVRFFEFAKESDEPIVLHILTKKGKGFPVALKEPEKWHGSGPFDEKTGAPKAEKPNTPPKYQDVFGECLAELALQDKSITGITAAMPAGTGLDALEKKIPDRFYDAGIAEEHAVLMAAGMATQGLKPVWRNLLHFPAKGLRPNHSRRLSSKSTRHFLPRSSRLVSKRRSHSSRCIRSLLPSLRTQLSSYATKRRRRASGYAPHWNFVRKTRLYPISER